MPRLERENEIPLSLFLLLKDQCIMSFNGPVALILSTARNEIAKVIGDEHDQDICLNRIMAAHRNMIKRINEEKDVGNNR